MYNLVILMGKAGSGKDSLMREVIKRMPELHEIVHFTTRPKREHEVDGVNYYFISRNDFGMKVLSGDMIECTEFNDWFYGTDYDCLNEDKINIGVFNPEGVDNLGYRPDVRALIFYIQTNDKERLLRQLKREDNPDVEEIIRRYGTDKKDFMGIEDDFEDVIVLENNKPADFSICVSKIIDEIKDKFHQKK